MSDEILRQAVEGISDLITTPGIINVDFADIRAVLSDAGSALLGIGLSSSDNRAEEAAHIAINSPLLDISISGAKAVLFAIAGGDDLKMHEIQTAARIITEAIDHDARVIFGAIKDEKLKKNEIKITVIASGFPEGIEKRGLFSGSAKKEAVVPMQAEGRVKREIHNSFIEEIVSTQPQKVEVVREVFNASKQDKDPVAVIDLETEGSEEDWSAVPAFLRRNKKI